jgi:hypothetical protein
MLRKVIIVVLSAGLFCALPQLRAEHPDLAGAWVLDAHGSTFSGPPQPASGSLTITVNHKTIHVAESMQLPNGVVTKEFDWKIDGEFHPLNSGEGEVLAKWEGDTLVGNVRSGDGAERQTIRMTMPNPETLSETIHKPSGDSSLIWKRR